MATSRDGCIVDSGPLTAVLEGFISDWNRTRPRRKSTTFSGDAGRVAPVGPVDWLVAAAEVPSKTIDNILARRTKTTELRIADALVAALERPDLFHDGTLTIRPNPRAGREAREACCPGSLTGGLEHDLRG